MPELPEVETIRRQLAPHLEGRRIMRMEILDPRWTRPDPLEPVERELRGAVVQNVGRSGKYLIWSLTRERFLLIHLRMTGALLFDPDNDPPHTRVRIELDEGHRLLYIDPRRFGTGNLLFGRESLDAYLGARLGVEPFTADFTTELLQDLARGRRAPIKSLLLDQKQIAGVGNIYADEALFRARIHPLRAAGKVTRPQLALLRDAIEESLRAGIEAKGASIDDFRHVDGARGSFQDLFLVHRREGEPCPYCGTPIRKMVVGGRGTYYCPNCQPRPRNKPVTRRRAGQEAVNGDSAAGSAPDSARPSESPVLPGAGANWP
jgi:formamidopyrimidine-DNA glycosylase